MWYDRKWTMHRTVYAVLPAPPPDSIIKAECSESDKRDPLLQDNRFFYRLLPIGTEGSHGCCSSSNNSITFDNLNEWLSVLLDAGYTTSPSLDFKIPEPGSIFYVRGT